MMFAGRPITCERCHGPGEAHAAQPLKTNIVNPVRLDVRRRDSVCEQCHLGGEARIPKAGRQAWDYRPGELLEDTVAVFVSGNTEETKRQPMKVVSHFEQLAASKCAQASGGRLWCGSCHDPHAIPERPAAYFNGKCRQCHASVHAGRREDCIGCHMKKRETFDGGHTAFTDHRIVAKPGPIAITMDLPTTLRPWRESTGAAARRDLGLAYISAGERDQSAWHLSEGFRHLAEVQDAFPRDPAVLTSLAAVLQRKHVPLEAAALFRRAAALERLDARHWLNLGIALLEAGDTSLAANPLQTAIALDPFLREAYILLAGARPEADPDGTRRKILEEYLEIVPESIVVRGMLRPR